MGKYRGRAEALAEDLKTYQPKRYKAIKKDGEDPTDVAERFLEGVMKSQQMTLDTLKKQIPKDIPPEEMEWRLNEAEMQAEELANEDIMNWLR